MADALSRLFMGSVSHVNEKRLELVKDVNRLSRLGVHLMIISNSGVKSSKWGRIILGSGG